MSQPQLALLVMVISSGSIVAIHVNEVGFRIMAKYFNMAALVWQLV